MKQSDPGYSGIAIYPGDRLISIDNWNIEHEPIEIIKTALRGPVNSLAKMKFVRRVLKGASTNGELTTQGHSVQNRTKNYVDFSFEVDVLRVLDGSDGRQTLTTSQSLYGLLAVRDKANSLLGIEEGQDKGNVIPTWAAHPKLKSKSVSSWMTNNSTATSASPMKSTNTLYLSPSPAIDISFSSITSEVVRESAHDAYTVHNASHPTATYSAGDAYAISPHHDAWCVGGTRAVVYEFAGVWGE